jgi:hypothetical protein
MYAAAFDAALALVAIAGWAFGWARYYYVKARASGAIATEMRRIFIEHLLFTGLQGTIVVVTLCSLSFVMSTIATVLIAMFIVVPATCAVSRRWARRIAFRLI